MRWLTYFILAYVALGVQVGLDGYIDAKKAAPNFVLMVVVFLGINGTREPVLLGSFLLGLMQDLFTLQPLGTWALCYSLVALSVLSVQEIVYREHPLTHFSLVLVGGISCAVVLTLQAWLYPMLHGGAAAGGRGIGVLQHLASALYSAILAPVVLGVLQRMRGAFAFRKQRA
jgi:rod shape-determining protein MreD